MVDSGTPAARNDQTAATVQAAGLDRSKVDSPSIFQELIIAQVARQITREEAERHEAIVDMNNRLLDGAIDVEPR